MHINGQDISTYLMNIETTKQDLPLVLHKLCAVFAIAELATARSNEAPWLIEDRFNKRRTAYEFDKHLQNLLLYSNGHDTLVAYCIECGKSNMYKAEIIVNDMLYLHCHQSFNPNAKYNEKYLNMNLSDMPKYAYLLYTLDSEKKAIKKLELVIPNRNMSKEKRADLTYSYFEVRKQIYQENRNVLEFIYGLGWSSTKALGG